MKAENLMVGDWVYFFCDYYERVKVTQEDFGNPFFFPKTKPIPITPEILKKNGFRLFLQLVNGEYKEYNSADKRITIGNISNTIGKDWHCHIDNEDFQSIGSADIQYVHELQHILRLCGIEKEIEL